MKLKDHPEWKKDRKGFINKILPKHIADILIKRRRYVYHKYRFPTYNEDIVHFDEFYMITIDSIGNFTMEELLNELNVNEEE